MSRICRAGQFDIAHRRGIASNSKVQGASIVKKIRQVFRDLRVDRSRFGLQFSFSRVSCFVHRCAGRLHLADSARRMTYTRICVHARDDDGMRAVADGPWGLRSVHGTTAAGLTSPHRQRHSIDDERTPRTATPEPVGRGATRPFTTHSYKIRRSRLLNDFQRTFAVACLQLSVISQLQVVEHGLHDVGDALGRVGALPQLDQARSHPLIGRKILTGLG